MAFSSLFSGEEQILWTGQGVVKRPAWPARSVSLSESTMAVHLISPATSFSVMERSFGSIRGLGSENDHVVFYRPARFWMLCFMYSLISYRIPATHSSLRISSILGSLHHAGIEVVDASIGDARSYAVVGKAAWCQVAAEADSHEGNLIRINLAQVLAKSITGVTAARS